MKHLHLCPYENQVPEWFASWVKIWAFKTDTISRKVQKLLSNNELEEALWIYNNFLHWKTILTGNHPGNHEIH